MIFCPALRKHLQRHPDALDVLEIEPQTMWLADDPLIGPYSEFDQVLDAIASLPGHKLVHSVGVPLGGTRVPDAGQMALLQNSARKLGSAWVSEHLSVGGTPHVASGFFLPPLQTEEVVRIAARNIEDFKLGVQKPVAVETGVSYLSRKPFEMLDGAFVARVAEESDCGILLDLHNIYCNERNGRISIDDFLADLPLDRVWEVHLAGGEERDGFWLDSHSGAMPGELAQRVPEIIRALPNLGAINFEIYDTFLERLDVGVFDSIIEKLKTVWSDAGQARGDGRPVLQRPEVTDETAPADAEGWEDSLTRAVWKADTCSHPWREDCHAIEVYSGLARSFRGSMLARTLPRSIRYLLLRDGPTLEALLNTYYDDVSPRLYAPLEAEAFTDWLKERGEADQLLFSLLDFDIAFLRIIREGKPQLVRFCGNPGPVFESLARAELPVPPEPPEFEIEILPDSESTGGLAGIFAGS
jgi:uncharacterized protein (UPF0276 family)